MTEIEKLNTIKIEQPSIMAYEYMYREDLTDLVLQDNIKSINERAFANCKNLERIKLPEDLEYIGPSAFSGCELLEEIVLPKNLKKIDYRAFADCKRLKKIVIPEGVEELDWGVFSGCCNLEEVVLPESLKKMGAQLFLNCKKLKEINIPTTIKELPDECFKGCKNLDIVLNTNIKKLGNSVFENCFKLEKFPESIEEYGKNCFKNCRNIKTVIINDQVRVLPDGLFDGCINLNNISSINKVKIGQKCFRNCRSLKEIPSFITNFSERAFENCTGITEVTIINDDVPMGCFRGCRNLKEVRQQRNIFSMGSFAFSGCDTLEEFNIYNLTVIPAEAFSHCKNLKKINMQTGIKKIDARAFYNCPNLSDINLVDTIEIIKKEAFRKCKKINAIVLPMNLISFGSAAFADMDSLVWIDVSPYNKVFATPDHKILINKARQSIVLYASGLKDKSYSFENYNLQYGIFGDELIIPTNSIEEYAFAGAKNLEELTVCGCIKEIDATSFYGCENLKKLNIKAIPLFTCPGFQIRDRNMHYCSLSKNKVYFPFEEVNFSGELVAIFPRALEHFTNVKHLTFQTNKPFTIAAGAFSDCSLLEEVEIPKEVKAISFKAFSPKTNLKFVNGLNLHNFSELIHDDKYIGEYNLYVCSDGAYYIEQGSKITKITKEQIDSICSKSEYIRDNPILFFDFMNDLIKNDLVTRTLLNGILMATISLENRQILFDGLKNDKAFFLNIIESSKLLEENDLNTQFLLENENFSKFVDYVKLFRKYNIDKPKLQNKFFIANLDCEKYEELINFDQNLLEKTIEDSKLFEKKDMDDTESDNSTHYLIKNILKNNTLKPFMALVKKYNIKDKYLFNETFIASSNNPLFEEMLKVYDKNIKRLLKLSLVTTKSSSAIQNFSDLLKLMKITGCLEEDPIIRQRAATFISEKIFGDKISDNKKNRYRIVGDDIHRVFNFPSIREEFDNEFANFFLENYQKLFNEELKKAGFIQRVYLNFRQISKTCTSNKGSQRKLKVTIDKCKNYLSNVKFDGVTEENKDLADLIGNWYDDNNSWLSAQKIYKESLSAPRNIFTKITEKDGKIIYDQNPSHDLVEPINPNFSYQWLPKQDYDNLILGKYCNCCAHVSGAGQGIMRASMILDNCQNLVIRNNTGEIIAKAILYVNKEKGYAVFNNLESSIIYRDDDSIEKIYKAFLRGSTAFMETYNKNNPNAPITNISIGKNRNTILNYLTEENNHPEIDVLKSLDFGEYSLNGSSYSGDWRSGQKLVLKKKNYLL